MASELLGLEHRPSEVNEQQQRHDARDDVVEHENSSGAIAGDRDAPQRKETDDADGEIEQIVHGRPPDEDSSTVTTWSLGSH
jgi:hypothetical protein